MMIRKIILFIFIMCSVLSLYSCKDKTNPESNFNSYINNWKNKNFSGMYEILDRESRQKTDIISFTKKYEAIYDEIQVDSIDVKVDYPEEYKKDDNGNIIIPFSVKINTKAGEISFSHKASFKKEEMPEGEDKWMVKWDSSMILPDLGETDSVKVDDIFGKRGEIYDRNDKPLAINTEDGNRDYPGGISTGFVVGFARPITMEELVDERYKGYSSKDIVGAAGCEYQFEEKLKQKTGYRIYIVDSTGNEKKELIKKEPQNGENIKLTIDLDMQNALQQQLNADSGVGIAMNPKTGEVLGLVNSPGYDPNNKKISGYNKFRAAYAPGSTFKLITAAIGLNTKTLDPYKDKKIIGDTWQRDNWKDFYIKRIHPYAPPSDLRKAFIYSDNIYFAQTALDVGRIKYMEEAKKFGIGEKFPFDIPLTRESQLFNETINSEGQLANTAYGQAEVLMNPIHLATIYTLLVNDGNIIKPKLIYNESNSPEIWKSGVCSKEDADLMMKYLGEVVSDKNGTAHAAYTPGLSLAGKTGTAELKATRDQKVGQDNGWFIGIDTKNMDLEVCIFVEGVEKKGGSEYCVKKSKKIFEQFSKK